MRVSDIFSLGGSGGCGGGHGGYGGGGGSYGGGSHGRYEYSSYGGGGGYRRGGDGRHDGRRGRDHLISVRVDRLLGVTVL
jgi:hypothetical protein